MTTAAEIDFDEKTHAYVVGGRSLPSVTQILKEAGLVDEQWFTEQSAKRGTFVHRMLEFYDEGDLDEATVDPALAGYLDAWKRFLDESGFLPERIEARVVNLTYGYAGTVDRVGILNGERIVLDIKSGSLIHAVALQLAGYRECLDGIAGRFAVQVRDDGTYTMKEFKDRNDRGIFLAASAVVNWKRNHA